MFYKKIPNPPDEVITDLNGRKYMQRTLDDFAKMTPQTDCRNQCSETKLC